MLLGFRKVKHLGVCFHPHWATTSIGTNIPLYFSPDFSWSKSEKPLLLIGGVHGDEPEGVTLAQKTLDWLTEIYNSGQQDKIISPWILIPCINVDGFKMNQRVNARGVDLNRNFPSRDWSMKIKRARYFPGHQPTSEAETRALIKLIGTYLPRLIIHCHSWNPGIIVTGETSLREADVLAKATGYPLQNDIGYPTPGSLGQWAWFELQIPVICIEEQEHIDQSLVWPHFENGIKQVFGATP